VVPATSQCPCRPCAPLPQFSMQSRRSLHLREPSALRAPGDIPAQEHQQQRGFGGIDFGLQLGRRFVDHVAKRMEVFAQHARLANLRRPGNLPLGVARPDLVERRLVACARPFPGNRVAAAEGEELDGLSLHLAIGHGGERFKLLDRGPGG
jgi:hypothetical protein